MNELERQLSETLGARGDRARAGRGSIRDVRLRARRRARRRSRFGAGALVAAGSVGAVFVATRPNDSPRLTTAGNDGAGSGGVGALPSESGLWQCDRLVAGPLPTVTPTTVSGAPDAGPVTPVIPTTVSGAPDDSVTALAADPNAGTYYMSGCVPIDISGATTLPPTLVTIAAATLSPPTTLIVGGISGLTTIDTVAVPYTTAPGDPVGLTTTTSMATTVVPVLTIPADGSSVGECVHLVNDSLTLEPQCWKSLSPSARTTFVNALRTYLQPSGYTIYLVQSGDTMLSIASHLGLTVDQLAAANGDNAQLMMYADMPLLIPAPAG